MALIDAGGDGGSSPAGGTSTPPSSSPAPAPAPVGNFTYDLVWRQWAMGVLTGIGAPGTDTNLATLWAWSAAESPVGSIMRWNNPLNTKQPEPGATDALANGVKRYPNVVVGIAGTKDTLLNGYYPALVEALRSSKPLSSWGAPEAANVTKWGTNTSFIHARAPGPIPDTGANPSQGTGTVPDPFGVGSALGAFGGTLSKDLVYGLEIAAGLLFIIGGLAILVLVALKGSAPAAARLAATATPQGRALGAVGAVAGKAAPAATPAPARPPLSPQASSSLAAARAGRGSRLSPSVRAELGRSA